MIFESHGHYDDESFDLDREEVINSLVQNGIEYVVNVGASIETTKKTLELTEKYPFFYGAVGVHPNEAMELNEDNFLWLKEVSCNPKVVAIGEIGLDYYWDDPDRETQKAWFIRQIELAKEVNLPMIIHSRDAAKDTYDILCERGGKVGGVIHCFSYAKEMAERFLDLGFYIGIGGVVTFNNAKKLKEAVKYIPLERILLETDCPYLSPVPNRGKRNSSLNLTYIAREIASIKEVCYEEVVEVTSKNAKHLFDIK